MQLRDYLDLKRTEEFEAYAMALAAALKRWLVVEGNESQLWLPVAQASSTACQRTEGRTRLPCSEPKETRPSWRRVGVFKISRRLWVDNALAASSKCLHQPADLEAGPTPSGNWYGSFFNLLSLHLHRTAQGGG